MSIRPWRSTDPGKALICTANFCTHLIIWIYYPSSLLDPSLLSPPFFLSKIFHHLWTLLQHDVDHNCMKTKTVLFSMCHCNHLSLWYLLICMTILFPPTIAPANYWWNGPLCPSFTSALYSFYIGFFLYRFKTSHLPHLLSIIEKLRWEVRYMLCYSCPY